MNNIDKAILVVRKAGLDKSNYLKYSNILEELSKKERKSGRTKEADFIETELAEALAVATQ
jgi:hypothetical protein